MVEQEGEGVALGRFDGGQAEASPLHVNVRRVGDRSIVAPVGDVDLSTAGVLSAQLQRSIAPGVATVEVDCGGVRFLDSSGINAVLEAWQRHAHPRGVRVTVVNAPRFVERVLQVAGVWELLQP